MALNFRISSQKLTPHADFALWGPRHLRMLKKLRLRGMVFDQAGELVMTEIAGPPTHHVCCRCCRLLQFREI